MSCEIQKTDYFEHLVNTESCIYHKLVLEFEALESCLNRAYGDRTVLFFRGNNISYGHMFRFLQRETRTLSSAEFLMVDCKSILETSKWASFYTKKEKVEQIKKALKDGKC